MILSAPEPIMVVIVDYLHYYSQFVANSSAELSSRGHKNDIMLHGKYHHSE